MADLSKQKLVFICCNIISISLLVVHWLVSDSMIGFFLTLFLVCMMLLRWRVPRAGFTSVLDVFVYVVLAPAFLGITLFTAMYYGMYFVMLAAVYVFFVIDVQLGVIAILCGCLGLLLRLWELEQQKRHKTRDTEVERYYQLEAMQDDLMSATAQIERMTVVSERARISREIHDNAGHEIVAAYISLQTIRNLFDGTDPSTIALYDAALERLDAGAKKIRDAVHNLAPIAVLGVETLQETCKRFPKKVDFTVFGNTQHVPIHIWSILESCLNEGLTNIGKHANPSKINIELDTTPHIVRLTIENDGVALAKKSTGTGLRNLRYRLTTAGGSLAVAHTATFHIVCVLPIAAARH